MAVIPTMMNDLLGLKTLSHLHLSEVMKRTSEMVPIVLRQASPLEILKSAPIALLFAEPSTRTRFSFEVAIRYLGGHPLVMNLQESSLKKGETLEDTVCNLEALGVQAIIVRHSEAGIPERIAQAVSIPIINAGDGANEHPTQGLLDLYTLIEHFGSVEGKQVGIVGDILHSRVARSSYFALKGMGAKVSLCGPTFFMPSDLTQWNVTTTQDFDSLLPQLDAVMMLRVQHERRHENLITSLEDYHADFGLTMKRLAMMKPGSVVMHPGPINRGVEIESEVADGENSLILRQVRNGVAVRMAVLSLLCAHA